MYQNLWDIAKAALRITFISMSTCTRISDMGIGMYLSWSAWLAFVRLRS